MNWAGCGNSSGVTDILPQNLPEVAEENHEICIRTAGSLTTTQNRHLSNSSPQRYHHANLLG
jgi:hypothetical protein